MTSLFVPKTTLLFFCVICHPMLSVIQRYFKRTWSNHDFRIYNTGVTEQVHELLTTHVN